jgi:hypothetical protein
MTEVKVRVPGKAFYAALDPSCTAVPQESGWPTPARHRVGRGEQFRYTLTMEQAEEMRDHLETMSECLRSVSQKDDDGVSYREGTACQQAAWNIAAAIRNVRSRG